jgi:hypothetical protein
LDETAAHWPSVERAFSWVHQAAKILANHEQTPAATVRRRLSGLLGAMSRDRQQAGELALAVDHFVKVSRSYWPGLFHCYEVRDLPRTNNDLEQLFGSYRWHERRITGRKTASPALVGRGSVRLPAAIATRSRQYSAKDLVRSNTVAWQTLRRNLDHHRETQRQRHRFRRNPQTYLAQLEAQLIQSTLPP